MKRQVGKTRRSRARESSASSGAVRPQRAAEAELEEEPAASYNAAPHDPTTERELAGALAGYKHHGRRTINPDDFYDVALARIARAFLEHANRIHLTGASHQRRGDGYVFAYTYDGLEQVLADLGDIQPRARAFYAGIIAVEAPVTGNITVDRLEELARARRRLIELEAERAELEAAARNPRR